MVDPVSEAERERFVTKLRAGLALLVGLSAGLIALHGEAGAIGLVGSVAVGTVVGGVLVRVAFPAGDRGDRPDR